MTVFGSGLNFCTLVSVRFRFRLIFRCRSITTQNVTSIFILLPNTGVQNVLTMMQALDFCDACQHSCYDLIYSSPWAPHIDIEIEHSKLTEVFRRWASPVSPASAPDKMQMIIFEVILLLCTDEVNLSPGTKNACLGENIFISFDITTQNLLFYIV